MTEFQTTQAEVSGDLIDLSIGHPSPALLPLDILNQAAEHRLTKGDRTFLQYGYEQGDGYFREALAHFLEQRCGTRVEADQLFVSNGASQALDLICTLYSKPDDVIFVEEPSYFLALRIFEDHRLRIVSLPTDDRGLIVEAVEERLARESPVFLYTVPTHQNPSGATLPLERRKRIVELSKQHGFLILADEVYHLLSYTKAPPTVFGSFVSEGSVVSLGSFSKILAPGLRLGWIHASPDILRPLVVCGMLDSGGGLNPFTSGLVRSVIELGLLDRHLERLRSIYGERLAAMSSALHRQLDGLVHFIEPWGGFFFWIGFPEGTDTQKFLPRARECRVKFMPGMRFSSREGMRNYMRLCFSYYDREAIEEGVRRLAGALRSGD
jgi:2-aminoadipate transaminase